MTTPDDLVPLTRGTTLVLGGARSGKSRLAEAAAHATGLRRVYVATATVAPGDDDLRRRIDRHRADRGAGWTTIEEPIALVDVLDRGARADAVVVVDCLTLWLANLLYGEERRDPSQAATELVEALDRAEGPVILVSNEVGYGLHPGSAVGREFRDEQGRLNQRVAAVVDHVRLTVAGIPVVVKG